MKRGYCRGKTCLLDWSVVSVVHSKHNKMKFKVKGICLRISEVYALACLMQKKTTTFKNLWNCEKRGNQSKALFCQWYWPSRWPGLLQRGQCDTIISLIRIIKTACFLQSGQYFLKNPTMWKALQCGKIWMKYTGWFKKNFQLWFDSNQWDNFKWKSFKQRRARWRLNTCTIGLVKKLKLLAN